jgi:hypothetical protein
MITQYPDLKFHFSYESGVSLALPKTWVPAGSLGMNVAALYIDSTAAEPVPKLAIQVFPVGEQQPDAIRQVAQVASDSARPEYQLIERKESTLDSRPAIVTLAQWIEPDGDGTPMTEYIAVAQLGDVVYVIMGLTPTAMSELSMITFKGALASARFLAHSAYEESRESQLTSTDEMLSLFDDELMLSLMVPRHWEAVRSEEFPLNLFAPEEQGYRTHLSFGLDQISPPTLAEFQNVLQRIYYDEGLSLEGYNLTQGSACTLAERPAFVAYYDWHAAEIKADISQLDALIFTGTSVVYKVHGYTLKTQTDVFMPVLENVISSIRFIPNNT